MNQKINLRFLLSLGGQKVVITQQQDETQIYAALRTDRPNVSPIRLSEAVQSR